jgi:hypothetical protein
MAFPVTHILVPMFIAETYRRYCAKREFSKWWVFIAGLMGGLPDFDILFGWVLNGYLYTGYHRQATHSMIIPILTLAVGLVLYALYSRGAVKSEGFRTSYILMFLATIGFTTHIALDLICGFHQWFYPFNWTLDLPNLLRTKYRAAMLDGILLFMWILYDEEFLNDILQFLKLKKKYK